MPSHLDQLDEEITALFAEVFALTARALAKLAEFDRLGGAVAQSYQSTAHWMNFRIGMSLSAAREHVRVARALETLPLVREKFAAGTLSYSKVRALTRVVTPENEFSYLVVANDTTASQLEKVVRACRRVTLDEARRQIDGRSVEMGFGDDGMFFLRARLTPEEGARVMAAIDARTPDERTRSWEERRADALLALVGGGATPKVELVVHVDASAEDSASAAQVETPRGERVTVAHDACRRLACNASVVVMKHDADGHVLDVGRRTRKIPAALGRALATRDGGETKLSNLIQLCSHHHARLHEGGFTVALAADGTASFFDSRGQAVAASARLPDASDETRRQVAAAAAARAIAKWNGTPWTSRSIDYGYVVSGLVSAGKHV